VNKNQGTNLTRSSTYDRLPTNEDEATNLGLGQENQTIENNNNFGYVDDDNCHKYLKSVDPANHYTNDSMNGNFKFTTFVKSPNSDIKPSVQALTDKKKSKANSKPGGTIAASVDDSSGVSSASSGSSHRKTCLVTTV